jgi:hypothetical protein
MPVLKKIFLANKFGGTLEPLGVLGPNTALPKRYNSEFNFWWVYFMPLTQTQNFIWPPYLGFPKPLPTFGFP